MCQLFLFKEETRMFHQILSPVAGNLFLSFLVGLIPIAVVLIMLGILRRPAWQAALAGLVIGLCFGALMEGIAGFGAPVAIGSALLIALGFPALEAITLTLIFNTAPVAFGALGTPITTLAAVTHLPVTSLSAMVGRQLPVFALVLPFYALIIFSGFRSLRTTWPVALVAGASFALTQFAVSNFIGKELPDVLASLVSLICVIGFVQVWKPRDIEQYRAQFAGTQSGTEGSTAIGEENVSVPVPASSN